MNSDPPRIMHAEDRVIGPPPDRSVYVIQTADRKIAKPREAQAAGNRVISPPLHRRGKK